MILTTDEIKKFCDILDAEFTTKIKPALKTAYREIKPVFDMVQDSWLEEMRRKTHVGCLHMKDIIDADNEVADCLIALGWYEDSVGDFMCDTKVKVIDKFDIAGFAFGSNWEPIKNGTPYDILRRMERDDALKTLASAKRRLDIIKNAYVKMFNPVSFSKKTLFEVFKGIAEAYRDRVMDAYENTADHSVDDEIRRMFKKDA